MLKPDELGIDLLCPECRRPLARIDQTYICSDGVCRRAYAIVDDIPQLVVDAADILDLAEWQAHLAGHPITAAPHPVVTPEPRQNV